MKKQATYLLLSIVFFACTNKQELDGKAYLSWVKNPENGLKVEKEISGINYTAQYKPYDYIVLNEEKELDLATTLVKERKKKLAGMVYYNFRISTTNQTDVLAKGASDKSMYMQRSNYLSYDFQNDITLITETDSINCGLYHFVQGYGVVPYVDMVVGFPVDQVNKDQTLVINDQVFGNGIIKFHINKKDINNIPQLVTI